MRAYQTMVRLILASQAAMRMYLEACDDNAHSDADRQYMPDGREARVKEALRRVYQRRAIRTWRRAQAAGATRRDLLMVQSWTVEA